jgi:hypothetical protein
MDTIPEEPREGATSEAEATTEKKSKKEAFASLAMRMMFDISIGNTPQGLASFFSLRFRSFPELAPPPRFTNLHLLLSSTAS